MSLRLREDSRRGRRQREMLWAASDIFAAFGHDLANMQMIAESAGVTKATLYAHFGDKAQLFRAVIEYWMEELPEPSLPCAVNGELRTCLDVVARELLQQSMHPAFLALTNILLRSNWVPQKRWRQRYHPYQAYLKKRSANLPVAATLGAALANSCCSRSVTWTPVPARLRISHASPRRWSCLSRLTLEPGSQGCTTDELIKPEAPQSRAAEAYCKAFVVMARFWATTCLWLTSLCRWLVSRKHFQYLSM